MSLRTLLLTVTAMLSTGACGDDETCDKCGPIPCTDVSSTQESSISYSYMPEDVLKIAAGEWAGEYKGGQFTFAVRVTAKAPPEDPVIGTLESTNTEPPPAAVSECAHIWLPATVEVQASDSAFAYAKDGMVGGGVSLKGVLGGDSAELACVTLSYPIELRGEKDDDESFVKFLMCDDDSLWFQLSSEDDEPVRIGSRREG
jgi:hypothetical protein